MANRDGRDALRGEEEKIFDVLAQVLTSEQWAELLRAPLKRAIYEGNRDLAQKLMEAGAEIGYGLHEAVEGGHGEIASDLLENGASVDAKDTSANGCTSLHCAAQVGRTEMVQLLLVKGADIDALDEDECTPLHLAIECGHEAAALALMAAGADVSLRYGGRSVSIVHAAAKSGHVDIVRAAIEHGVDVDAVDTTQRTPLHYAARSTNQTEAIDLLVKTGASIEARDYAGETPLHYAAYEISLKVLIALFNHGADVNAHADTHETPLHIAAANAGRQGTAEVVDALLRAGADETILDNEGNAAVDVVGSVYPELFQLAEDVDRVRSLLANAPADRAWRRRGYLVLCRAHPDRMRQIQDNSSANADVARSTRSGAKLERIEASGCNGAVDTSTVDERGGGNWAVVVARVLGLREEGIFRTIVGYL